MEREQPVSLENILSSFISTTLSSASSQPSLSLKEDSSLLHQDLPSSQTFPSESTESRSHSRETLQKTLSQWIKTARDDSVFGKHVLDQLMGHLGKESVDYLSMLIDKESVNAEMIHVILDRHKEEFAEFADHFIASLELEEVTGEDIRSADKEDQKRGDVEDRTYQDADSENDEDLIFGRHHDDSFDDESRIHLSARSAMSQDNWDHREADPLYDEDATFHKRHFSSDSPFYDYDHANEFFIDEDEDFFDSGKIGFQEIPGVIDALSHDRNPDERRKAFDDLMEIDAMDAIGTEHWEGVSTRLIEMMGFQEPESSFGSRVLQMLFKWVEESPPFLWHDILSMMCKSIVEDCQSCERIKEVHDEGSNPRWDQMLSFLVNKCTFLVILFQKSQSTLMQQTQTDVDELIRSFLSMLIHGLDTGASINAVSDVESSEGPNLEFLQEKLCSAPIFALACADWEDDWRINLFNKRMTRQSILSCDMVETIWDSLIRFLGVPMPSISLDDAEEMDQFSPSLVLRSSKCYALSWLSILGSHSETTSLNQKHLERASFETFNALERALTSKEHVDRFIITNMMSIVSLWSSRSPHRNTLLLGKHATHVLEALFSWNDEEKETWDSIHVKISLAHCILAPFCSKIRHENCLSPQNQAFLGKIIQSFLDFTHRLSAFFPDALPMCWDVIGMVLRVPVLLQIFCESTLFPAIRSRKENSNPEDGGFHVEYIDERSWKSVLLSLLSHHKGHALIDELDIWRDALACVAEKISPMRCDTLLDFQVAHFVSHVFGNARPCDDGTGNDMSANRIAEVLLHELESEFEEKNPCDQTLKIAWSMLLGIATSCASVVNSMLSWLLGRSSKHPKNRELQDILLDLYGMLAYHPRHRSRVLSSIDTAQRPIPFEGGDLSMTSCGDEITNWTVSTRALSLLFCDENDETKQDLSWCEKIKEEYSDEDEMDEFTEPLGFFPWFKGDSLPPYRSFRLVRSLLSIDATEEKLFSERLKWMPFPWIIAILMNHLEDSCQKLLFDGLQKHHDLVEWLCGSQRKEAIDVKKMVVEMIDESIDECNPNIRGVLHMGMMSIGQIVDILASTFFGGILGWNALHQVAILVGKNGTSALSASILHILNELEPILRRHVSHGGPLVEKFYRTFTPQPSIDLEQIISVMRGLSPRKGSIIIDQ
eukprot:TRINITY_DN1564_c0_g1_i2.p1 TRINITY_DN1564_c0_g1~~TRINITY_DN1564_c0_g1_i2.p1  ORF type:complete len:1170 (-),score=324.06 TRINITY_DN1564_c0_g1_i2:16-3525(-)